MNDAPAIHFEAVSKRFQYSADRHQSVLESILSTVSRRNRQESRELWAVKDVSFEVAPGDSLGIIGRNGSGKSTILKLASGIIRPSSGQVTINGRLSALLELGAGFHPELTGKENIALNASILGMSKDDINKCYQSIVEFSELEEFIQMPVKHYSSGMYMRLGFSVAVHVDPDVLIVDEILAVGDQSFQNKCIDRIFELKRRGTTIVLVSHNLETVRSLCSHLLWVEHGALQADGSADEIIDRYLESQEGWHLQHKPTGTQLFRRWGSHEIELTDVRLLGEDGEERDEFVVGEALIVEMSYLAHHPVEEPEFGLAFFRRDGIYVSGPDNQHAGLQMGVVEGKGVVRYQVDALPLLPAVYRLTAAIYDTDGIKPYDHHDKAYTFRVLADGGRKRKGIVEMQARWLWKHDQRSPIKTKESLEEKHEETPENAF